MTIYQAFLKDVQYENNRHAEKIHELKEILRLAQKVCKHKHTRFQVDPAGGNDSCYICEDCEKVL